MLVFYASRLTIQFAQKPKQNKGENKSKKYSDLFSNLREITAQNKKLIDLKKTYELKLADILKQNENMPGLKKLNKIGDQAFLHTDNKNFLIIISRKGNKIVRLKVNKLTSMTSLNELQNISKAITEKL